MTTIKCHEAKVVRHQRASQADEEEHRVQPQAARPAERGGDGDELRRVQRGHGCVCCPGKVSLVTRYVLWVAQSAAWAGAYRRMTAVSAASMATLRYVADRDPGTYAEPRGWEYYRQLALNTPDDQSYPFP